VLLPVVMLVVARVAVVVVRVGHEISSASVRKVAPMVEEEIAR